MVMYTGYACFPPKMVSCILSVDTMSSIIVAPGRCDSRDPWLHSSVWELEVSYIAHLYRPPPIAHIQFAVYSLCSLMVHIVSLGGKDQVLREFGISIDRADTKQDVLKMKLKGFMSDKNVQCLEWWVARQIVDD